MKEVLIYTDGGCRGNDSSQENIGAIGIVLIYKGNKKEYSEVFYNTTNNKMELTAVIKALQMLKEPCKVKLHSDSAYIVEAFRQGWVDIWKQNGWRRPKNEELKNRELWQLLDILVRRHDVEFIKVKGHSTDVYNNRCDEILNIALDEAQ
ncbi:MAG: ribonuclease HI [Eubacteriaceae bacterium]|jgi:ribonuclease HI|nr:ribonuclease HI [Eubacteriaceae bacterium]